MTVAFGTDGIRGKAGVWPIVPEVARELGRVAHDRAPGGIVLVGHDTRPSGVELAEHVAAGVVAAGGTARTAGVAPTAALQVALEAGIAGSAVMVTASHNPAHDNGFKLLLAGGRKPDDAAARLIEQELARPAAPPRAGGRTEQVAAAVRTRWAGAVTAAAGDLTALHGRRLAVDLANGAATAVAAELAVLLENVAVTWLGTGDGAINDGCGTEHLGHLAEVVCRERLDGGFAVDGDADRCRLVTADGTEIAGDAVAWRLALHLRSTVLVTTVMSSGALEALLPGVRVVRTPVGDRYVREAMDREGAGLGAEESGHVLFGDHAGGDGILTGLRALAACFAAAPDLAGAVAGFVPLPRVVRSVAVARHPPIASVPSLGRLERTTHTLGPYGRILLRYSGTEPVLRILVEGSDGEEVRRIAGALAETALRELA